MRNGHDLRPSSASVKAARQKHLARVFPDGTTGRVIGDAVDLDVNIDDLDDGGVDIHETLPTIYMSALLDDGHDVKWTARSPSKLDLHLENEAGFVRTKGKGTFALSHPCVRCLNDVPFDVPLEIDLRLVARERPALGEDEEIDEELAESTDLEDLNVASFTDDIVSVGDVLREQLFLELPMHPACDSARASPTAPCGFAGEVRDPGWVDPRWAALEALRPKLPPVPGAPAPVLPTAPKPAASSAPVPLPGRASPPVALKPVTTSKPVRAKAAPKKKPPKKVAPKKTAKKAVPKKKAARAKKKLAPKKKKARR